MFFDNSTLSKLKVKNLSLIFNDFFNNSEKAQLFLIEKEKRSRPHELDVYIKSLGFVNAHRKKGVNLAQVFKAFKPSEILIFLDTYLSLDVKCTSLSIDKNTTSFHDSPVSPSFLDCSLVENAGTHWEPSKFLSDGENIIFCSVSYLSNPNIEHVDKVQFLRHINSIYKLGDGLKSLNLELVLKNKDFLKYAAPLHNFPETSNINFDFKYLSSLLSAGPDNYSPLIPDFIASPRDLPHSHRIYLNNLISAIIDHSFKTSPEHLSALIESNPKKYYIWINDFFFELFDVRQSNMDKEKAGHLALIKPENKFFEDISIDKINYALSLYDKCMNYCQAHWHFNQEKIDFLENYKVCLTTGLLKKLYMDKPAPTLALPPNFLQILPNSSDVFFLLAKDILTQVRSWSFSVFYPIEHQVPLIRACFKSLSLDKMQELKKMIEASPINLSNSEKVAVLNEMCILIDKIVISSHIPYCSLVQKPLGPQKNNKI